MEIHHAHAPAKEKHFRHYLFEFLMLFLAVSAGFFVENIREHYVEKKRANVLATSLIKDMQKDTAQISWLQQFNQLQESRLDSFYELLNKPFSQINSRTYYRLARKIRTSYSFAPANGTINELKNAGYLRYFPNDSLPGLLAEYDFLYKDNEGQDQIISDLLYHKYDDLLIKTSDSRMLHLKEIYDEVPDSTGIMPISADDLKELKGTITIIHSDYLSSGVGYSDLRKKAVQIMKYLHRSFRR